jgi:uncharacterized membrane protein YhhN
MYALAGGLVKVLWVAIPEKLQVPVVVYATLIATMACVYPKTKLDSLLDHACVTCTQDFF